MWEASFDIDEWLTGIPFTADLLGDLRRAAAEIREVRRGDFPECL